MFKMKEKFINFYTNLMVKIGLWATRTIIKRIFMFPEFERITTMYNSKEDIVLIHVSFRNIFDICIDIDDFVSEAFKDSKIFGKTIPVKILRCYADEWYKMNLKSNADYYFKQAMNMLNEN